MKTTFVKTVALAIMMLTGLTGANLFAGNKYVVNYETENNRVSSKIVYIYNGSLQQHMKYNYSYDIDGRVIEKESLKWNKENQEWTPYYINTFSYRETSFVIDFAVWNPKDKVYNQQKARNVYQMNEESNPVSCAQYIWKGDSETWNFINKINYQESGNIYASSEIK